ncbi:Inner membrane protein YrbG [Maioricimonas rarisocia]|uniref:Inner membrane protein YrbG n=1 Tax=Maioricimonas rarisocia TaxID=2528026 RepID=A0A517Z0W1_9PLAN|nr:calcium/sodium antiporter [Maioricimonas rarisocia]QDU36117.1 Inner membrane protein YrbG [Maioricimonas rarisocia]
MLVASFLGGIVLLTIGAELLVRSASRLAATAGISPLVIGLTVVAYGTSAPEFVVSLSSTLSGRPDVALGNVVGSNIFNVLFILGVSALIIPLRVSQQLVRLDVPLMAGLSILVLLMALDGRVGRIDGLFLTAGMIAYTVWAIRSSRKEQTAIREDYEAEFGVPDQPTTPGAIALNSLLLAAGLALLVLGSKWFVGAAVVIARQFGVSELVIGLTIVAAGTSLPEVATSIMAAVRGERDIAVGNVVGSNLFNLMGVLGVSSLISVKGVIVPASALSLDLPVMVAAAIATLPIFLTGHLIARWEGWLLLGYYVAYTAYIVVMATIPELSRSFAITMIGFVIPLTVITLAVSVIRARRETGSDEPTS